VILRKRHAFEGKSLAVMGRMRRHGELELVLVLPDGSRTLVPASWTDFDREAPVQDDARLMTLARVTELLRARLVVDGLLRRMDAASDSDPFKEAARAIDPVGTADDSSRFATRTGRVVGARRGSTRSSGCSAGATDGEDRPTRGARR
jgi:hypothetical protein